MHSTWQRHAHDPATLEKQVFPVMQDGRRYWIKRSGKATLNHFQELITHGREPFGGEPVALRALQKRGANIPDIIYQDRDFIVLSDIGIDVHRWLAQAHSDFARKRMVIRVARALYDLHTKGGWHGNAAMRNFSWHDHRVYMLDLADTAHEGWSLQMRQAYDVWQALYSLGRQHQGVMLTRQWLKSYPARIPVRLRLKAFAWLLSPFFTLLWPFNNRLKRDISQGVIAIQALLLW